MNPFNEARISYTHRDFKKYETIHAPWSHNQNYIFLEKTPSLETFQKMCLFIEETWGSEWLRFKCHPSLQIPVKLEQHLAMEDFTLTKLTLMVSPTTQVLPVSSPTPVLKEVTLDNSDYFTLRASIDQAFGATYSQANGNYLRRLLAQKRLKGTVAYINGEPIGIMEIIPLPSQPFDELYFIYVLPAYRRQGIAANLMTAHANPVFAVVATQDTALTFYQNLGFSPSDSWYEFSK